MRRSMTEECVGGERWIMRCVCVCALCPVSDLCVGGVGEGMGLWRSSRLSARVSKALGRPASKLSLFSHCVLHSGKKAAKTISHFFSVILCCCCFFMHWFSIAQQHRLIVGC